MKRYQLAKLIEWSGESLKTRKRLQKVVYLLQAAGCPLDADYTLHLEELAKQLLIETSLPKLEMGATVAYFHKHGKPWKEARLAAAKFKNQEPEGRAMNDAEEFARWILRSESAT